MDVKVIIKLMWWENKWKIKIKWRVNNDKLIVISNVKIMKMSSV
jgi:hypothetical protein